MNTDKQFPIAGSQLVALGHNYTKLQLLVAMDLAVLHGKINNVPYNCKIEIVVNNRPIYYFCDSDNLATFVSEEINRNIESLRDAGVNIDDIMAAWEAATAAAYNQQSK